MQFPSTAHTSAAGQAGQKGEGWVCTLNVACDIQCVVEASIVISVLCGYPGRGRGMALVTTVHIRTYICF